jgi:class 3 adenylate cyclase
MDVISSNERLTRWASLDLAWRTKFSEKTSSPPGVTSLARFANAIDPERGRHCRDAAGVGCGPGQLAGQQQRREHPPPPLIWETPQLALDQVEAFLTGVRRTTAPTRVLATVLFTDIVGSTEQASRLGDRRWRELLDVHDELARRLVEEFGGQLVKTTGDGILATFDGPGRAVRCAAALGDELAGIGVQLRAGLHAGEVELRDGDVGGIAVHIAARVMAAAQPGEVLTSRTVRDLVAGC